MQPALPPTQVSQDFETRPTLSPPATSATSRSVTAFWLRSRLSQGRDPFQQALSAPRELLPYPPQSSSPRPITRRLFQHHMPHRILLVKSEVKKQQPINFSKAALPWKRSEILLVLCFNPCTGAYTFVQKYGMLSNKILVFCNHFIWMKVTKDNERKELKMTVIFNEICFIFVSKPCL